MGQSSAKPWPSSKSIGPKRGLVAPEDLVPLLLEPLPVPPLANLVAEYSRPWLHEAIGFSFCAHLPLCRMNYGKLGHRSNIRRVIIALKYVIEDVMQDNIWLIKWFDRIQSELDECEYPLGPSSLTGDLDEYAAELESRIMSELSEKVKVKEWYRTVPLSTHWIRLLSGIKSTADLYKPVEHHETGYYATAASRVPRMKHR